jgi:hypothetical protein
LQIPKLRGDERMNPMEWLTRHIPGFADLEPEEREAIMHFTLLWSLFEARALNRAASSGAIDALARRLVRDRRVDAEGFAEPLVYFRNRYFQKGIPTHHYNFLNLRRNDQPDLVRAVLGGNNETFADYLSVLLIVVYRLRNNLFHGEKWVYGLRAQRANFEHVNKILMSTLALYV